MDDPTLTFHVGRLDVLRANLIVLYVRPAVWFLRLVILSLAIIDALRRELPVLLVAAMAAIIFEIVFLVLSAIGTVIQTAGGPNRGALGKQRLEITEDALRITNSAGDISLKWHMVGRPHVRLNYLLIPIRGGRLQIIPLAQAEERIASFVEALDRKAGKNGMLL